jgi:hypothetical protein
VAGPLSLPNSPLAAVDPNVNAPDFVQQFSDAVSPLLHPHPRGRPADRLLRLRLPRDEEEELEAEIPDHWLEDNTAAHDHIAIKPVRVTLSGLRRRTGHARASSLKTAPGRAHRGDQRALPAPRLPRRADGVGNVSRRSQAISQAQSVVVQVGQTIARAAQLANILSGLLSGPSRNKQQKAFLQLKAYWQAGIIFTVHTPVRDADEHGHREHPRVSPPDSKDWSKFVVRMKQLQFVGGAGDAQLRRQPRPRPWPWPRASAPRTWARRPRRRAGQALGEALTVATKLVVP